MKFTNTEVEEFIEDIKSVIDYYKEGNDDAESTIRDIEKLCVKFKNEYVCPYEKHTAEWYDEHGE